MHKMSSRSGIYCAVASKMTVCGMQNSPSKATPKDTSRNEHAPVWGNESEIAKACMAWASNRVTRPSDPKTTARLSSELAHDAGRTVTTDGIGGAEALRIFDEVLAPATRGQDDPMNLAYIASAPTQAAGAFDSVVSAANIFAGTWEAGAGAIFAENEALDWLIELLGWKTGGGTFVSGGTIGNLSALTAARHRALTRRGSRPPGGWQLLCTADAHSSIRTAARVLDVEVVEIQEDDRGHLTGPALRLALIHAPNVFAVVASAGTTNAGIIDDLSDIADICAEQQIWLHVDGAYGGAAMAAPSARAQFDGIERADSFIVDPHKWLFAPYDCCALLYRDPAAARAAHTQTASYLDAIDHEVWNPTDFAIQLSRRARGLPFWFSLATHGTDRYAAAVEQTLTTARSVAAAIASIPQLKMVVPLELSVVLFERPGWTDSQYHQWSKTLSDAGLMMCVPTKWRGRTVLRLAFVNPVTQAEAVIKLLTTTTL